MELKSKRMESNCKAGIDIAVACRMQGGSVGCLKAIHSAKKKHTHKETSGIEMECDGMECGSVNTIMELKSNAS